MKNSIIDFKNLKIEQNGFILRLLEKNDYHKGFFELLNQLTTTIKPEFNEFGEYFDQLPISIGIFVIEKNEQIVATVRALFELKFYRGMKYCLHIEDVVVDCQFRGCGYAKILLNFIIDNAPKDSIYKLILYCSNEYVQFYEKFGFIKSDNFMKQYI